jgi:membrane-associated phospholipid phosphatase
MMALYGGLALLIGARIRSRTVGVLCWLLALLATAVIGFARVYRGMHHPSDVVAGALLGLATLGVAVVSTHTGQRARAERRHLRASEHSFERKVAA